MGGWTDQPSWKRMLVSDGQPYMAAQHRDYDSLTGTWLQPDPLGVDGDLASYRFAEGDPVNLTDPSGLCIDWDEHFADELARYDRSISLRLMAPAATVFASIPQTFATLNDFWIPEPPSLGAGGENLGAWCVMCEEEDTDGGVDWDEPGTDGILGVTPDEEVHFDDVYGCADEPGGVCSARFDDSSLPGAGGGDGDDDDDDGPTASCCDDDVDPDHHDPGTANLGSMLIGAGNTVVHLGRQAAPWLQRQIARHGTRRGVQALAFKKVPHPVGKLAVAALAELLIPLSPEEEAATEAQLLGVQARAAVNAEVAAVRREALWGAATGLFESWMEGEEPEEAAEGEAARPGIETDLPANPDDLLDQGYEDVSHPDAAASGHRKLHNPETGDTLDFDKGKEGAPGHAGKDHYHRPNPNKTSKGDARLDGDGNPVPKGSDASHLYPSRG